LFGISLIGNRKLMDDNNIPVTETVDTSLKQLEIQGKTAILAAIDNRLGWIITLADTKRKRQRCN
jgi:cation transport ATPase